MAIELYPSIQFDRIEVGGDRLGLGGQIPIEHITEAMSRISRNDKGPHPCRGHVNSSGGGGRGLAHAAFARVQNDPHRVTVSRGAGNPAHARSPTRRTRALGRHHLKARRLGTVPPSPPMLAVMALSKVQRLIPAGRGFGSRSHRHRIKGQSLAAANRAIRSGFWSVQRDIKFQNVLHGGLLQSIAL